MRPSHIGHRAGGVLLVCIAVARIALTWPVLTQTYDEPAKLALGMELLATHHFPAVDHPPLGLVSLAVPPRLAGVPFPGSGDRYETGNRMLHWQGRYLRNLTLARSGSIPFLILGCLVVWRWASGIGASLAGLFALSVLTLTPEVLAHSGLATNDMAGAATLIAALFCFTRWLDRRSLRSAALLGIASGAAIASKFTALLFLPVGLFAIAMARRGSAGETQASAGRRQLLLTFVLAWLTVWASYGSTRWPYTDTSRRPHLSIDRITGSTGVLHDVAYAVAENVPFPPPELPMGIAAGLAHGIEGHPAFLMGAFSHVGWWYYFPAAIAFKTPVLILLVWLGGCAAAFLRWRLPGGAAFAAPVAAASAILAVAMTSSINIGVRHVLPVCALLAIPAGVLLASLWRSSTRSRVLVTVLLAWIAAEGVRVHPDYLAYFNELSRKDPSRLLVDSNLDWGQDLGRLTRELKQRRIERLTLGYFGRADLTKHELPPFARLVPGARPTGWIAASETTLSGVYDGRESYAWLRERTPEAHVGKSIRLYYIPPSP